MVPRACAALVLILIVGLLALGQSSSVTAQDATPGADSVASPATTDVRYLLPFSPDGLHPDFTATETVEGVCGSSSLVAHDRPDAWDCLTTDSGILDPCFENPYLLPDEPGQMACLAAPFDADVVMLTLTEPLRRDKEVTAADAGDLSGEMVADEAIDGEDLPWGLELANGNRCALLRGTLTVIAGQVVHYGCTNGGFVLGETIRNQPQWTVNYLAAGATATTRVPVIAAWI